MKSPAQYVRKWFDERPEFGREWPTSEAAKIAAIVEMGDGMAWIERSIVRAFREAHGGNANRLASGTIYVDPVDMKTLDGFLTGYAQPQMERIGCDRRRLWSRICEWCAAHPEFDVTPGDVWKLAGGDDGGPDGVQAAAARA